MRVLTSPEGAETRGINVKAYFENLTKKQTESVAAKYNLANVDPEGWVPSCDFIGALNELAHSNDYLSTLVAIGLEIGTITPVAPGIENPTLEQVLMGWDAIYQYLHRNADVGKIVCEKVDDKHFKLTFTDLYPDDFSYGILYGYGRRMLPPGTSFKVFYDQEIKPRDRGGEHGKTIIHITWV
jgi:hypothetical protein